MAGRVLFTIVMGILLCTCVTREHVKGKPTLKSVLGDKFLIGVALNTFQSSGRDTNAVNIVKEHFNAITPENCMKSEFIHPEENVYDFRQVDEFVEFGEDNGLSIIGNCLIWHSQLSSWFCVDKDGNNVSPEVLKKRMRDHITMIVCRYKGRIKGWEVVNEAIMEDGSFRKNKFYEILGEEYIPLAFQYAQEADPDVELYYNDYNMHLEKKRNAVVKLVNDLQARRLRIDAIGMQGHLGLDYPKLSDFEESIEAFASTGCNVMITEWDMSALPSVNYTANVSDTAVYQDYFNPYVIQLPDSISKLWNQRMSDFMSLFIKHSDVISRVTVWGVSDSDSWRNNFPMYGCKDYALLFDRDYQPKSFVKKMLTQLK